MLEILLYVLVFYAGLCIGYLLHWWLSYRGSYSGTIYINRTTEKTLYSLELDEDPETIDSKREIVFKVVSRDVEPNRD